MTCFPSGVHGVGGALGTKEWDAISGSSVNTANNTTTLLFFPNASASHTVSGYLGGVQGGFNYQFNSIVAGIEAQGSWSNLAGRGNCFQDRAPIANIDASISCASTVRSLGTIAGRLGFLANNNTTMIFVKGGAAWAADRYSQNQTNSGTTGIVVPPGMTGQRRRPELRHSQRQPVGQHGGLGHRTGAWPWCWRSSTISDLSTR